MPNASTTARSTGRTSTRASSGTTSRTTTTRRRKAVDTPDAITLLKADHKEVKQLFKAYDTLAQKGASDDERAGCAQQICNMLTVHATVEEELLYPAAHDAIDAPDLVDEATVEHASAKELVAQIVAASPTDPLYDAKVKVLGEYIDHHVKEEEGELFPQLKKSGIDLDALGQALYQRKQELIASVS